MPKAYAEFRIFVYRTVAAKLIYLPPGVVLRAANLKFFMIAGGNHTLID